MEFTQKQLSVLTGSLLGDGSITKITKSGKAQFVKGQKRERREYLDWHYEELKPFSSRVRNGHSSCLGKKFPNSTFYTNSLVQLGEMRQKWYPNGKKIIPRNINLDPLVLAVWYCDDGHNNVKKRLIQLHTQGFSRDDCLFLISLLQSTFGIEGYMGDKKKNIIYIRCKHHEKFIGIVNSSIIWDCFNYKVGLLPRKQNRYIVFDGEIKQAVDLAKDVRCSVQSRNISVRLREGWAVEDAVSIPLGADNSTEITAFGETKKLNDWLIDCRCKCFNGNNSEIERYKIIRRIKKGWSPESAISIPTKQKLVMVTAYGETKSISDWSKDSRCNVSYKGLHKRISKGWNIEKAISENCK